MICVTSRWLCPEPLLLRGTFFSTLMLLLGFSMAPAQPFAMRFCRKSHRDMMDFVLLKSWGVKKAQKGSEGESINPTAGALFWHAGIYNQDMTKRSWCPVW